MPKEKIILIRADFINSDTPTYVNDISFNKYEGNPEYSRRIVNMEDMPEKEKLMTIYSMIDNFKQIVIYEKKDKL